MLSVKKKPIVTALCLLLIVLLSTKNLFSDFFTRNHHSKNKTLFPLIKVKKVTLSESLRKTKSNDTIGVAMVVVVLILRLMKHEKECEMKTVTRTPSSGILIPNFHNRFHSGHPSWIYQKTFEFWGDFA